MKQLAWITYLHPKLVEDEEKITEALEKYLKKEKNITLATFYALENFLESKNMLGSGEKEWFDDISHTSVPNRFEYTAWLEGKGESEKIISFYYDDIE